jgi:hypothetical protein
MKNVKKIALMVIAALSFSYASSAAQIKNAKTETVKIFGNCGMCKTTIETAGNKKHFAKVDWNKDTKIAVITYNNAQTNTDEILKRIALAGYDSDKFLAPDDAYNKLPGCCQYERVNKTQAYQAPTTEAKATEMKPHNGGMEMQVNENKQEKNQLKAVFENYFLLKNALVSTDGKAASTSAKALLAAINAVKMETLSADEHTVWMKVMKELAFDTEHIEETKDASHQREHFTSLSTNMYALMKVSKQETPVYYQHCPMANNGKGANWLSKENAIKNPYFGSQMMTCGKTVETIK